MSPIKAYVPDFTLRIRKNHRRNWNATLPKYGITGRTPSHYSVIPDYKLDMLEIESGNEEASQWEKWVAKFFIQPGFVMAWLADSDYQFWQSAEDPLQYTARGKSYDHLPMKSNGLPPPLDQKVIDTSQNPGRRVMRVGYFEVVSAIMWLGETFWEITGSNVQSIDGSDGVSVDRLDSGVVRIKSFHTHFVASDGRQREIQQGLRSLLFPAA